MSYWRFAAMIATSTVVMFALMYFNTYVFEHIFFSETRTYMAIVMGAIMAIIMLGFMWGMYGNTRLNLGILACAAVVFGVALWLVRSQVTVGDVSYMRAMIPHHSIAIMTSKRAEISDPRVRKLAGEIIAAQQKEIAEMRYLVHDIVANGDAGDDFPLGETPARLTSLDDALASAEIAVLDPEAMKPSEIGEVMASDPACRFRRTVDSDPILAVSNAPGQGLMKLNGKLIELAPDEAAGESDGATFSADGARLVVAPTDDGDAATLVFELDRGLRVGYEGHWTCA